jgi:hypothetical protein
MADFFLSYASKDAEQARAVCKFLRDSGASYWMAPESIHPGETYSVAISGAIRECHSLLVLFSKHADESPHVIRELTLADKYNKKIIPVRLTRTDPAHLEYHLGAAQWIDWQSSEDRARLRKLAEQFATASSNPTKTAVKAAVENNPSRTTLPKGSVPGDKRVSLNLVAIAGLIVMLFLFGWAVDAILASFGMTNAFGLSAHAARSFLTWGGICNGTCAYFFGSEAKGFLAGVYSALLFVVLILIHYAPESLSLYAWVVIPCFLICIGDWLKRATSKSDVK